jgi:hypothetical protein
MLRWPNIVHLANTRAGEDPAAAAHFMLIMETNGADPLQRDPHRAYRPETLKLAAEGKPCAGTIYREDVRIPADKRNDPEYIASAMARAWARIWQMTITRRGAREAADFDAADMYFKPHEFYGTGEIKLDPSLKIRPARLIPVNGPRQPAKLPRLIESLMRMLRRA